MSVWNDKQVLVLGGSSGLGLQLAKAWLARGAHVTIVGRDQARLDDAVRKLSASSSTGTVQAAQADVTKQADIEQLFTRIDRLDVLVNAFGRSDRGLAVETTAEKYDELMQLNFLAVTRCVAAAIESLKRSHGSIVNIGSIASKSVARFLGAYPASKFALAAYTAQLRMELSDCGVHTLLVCPGPIRRDDTGSRYDHESADLPESARKPGGGVKLKGIDADRLAAKVIKACESRRSELVVPGKARWLFAISQLWPRLGDWIVRQMT